jgi:hypothetical protein
MVDDRRDGPGADHYFGAQGEYLRVFERKIRDA